MKLLNKLQHYYFWFSTIFLIFGILITFFIIRLFIYRNAVERLKYQKEIVIEQIESDEFPRFKNFIEIKQVSLNLEIREQFSDTVIYEVVEAEFVPYKQITFSQLINEKNYLITIRQPISDAGRLIINIIAGMVGFFLILIIILIIFNRRINRKLWKPFYSNLENIKNYNLSHSQELQLEKTDIEEFNDLNLVADRMANKIKQDYRNLKEFTENTAHELQTPLAVMKSKIELLIQSESLNEDEMKQLMSISNAATRLSRLNQSLLLLTKIENRQFKDEIDISLKEIIERQVEELKELVEMRKLTLQMHILHDPSIKMNPDLADILVRNLFTNAIRYCSLNGTILIILNKNELSISNSGSRFSISPDNLFERFKKNNQETDSLGLGLAIVKSICNIHELEIKYDYKDDFHIFKILI